MYAAALLALLLGISSVHSQYIAPAAQPHIHPAHYSQRPAPPQRNQYSSQWCIGGKGRLGTSTDRTCLFHNLCYNPATQQYLYHRNSSEQHHAILADHGRIISEFPADAKGYVQLNVNGWNDADNVYMSPHIVEHSIDSNVHWVGSATDVAVVLASGTVSKAGQYLMDTLFAQYAVMASFGLLSNDVQPVYTDSCSALYNNAADIKQCQANVQYMTAGLSSKQPVYLSELKASDKVQCYSQVLIGAGPFGLQNSWGRGSIYREFRHYYLTNLGLHSTAASAVDTGVRIAIATFGTLPYNTLANAKELQQHLQAHVPHSTVDLIDTTAYEHAALLKYYQTVDVLIQPTGQPGLLGALLNENGAVINIDTYDINKKRSYGTEERLWSSLGYLYTYNYPVARAEIQLPAGSNEANNNEWRERGIVTVNVDTMQTLVLSCIDKMSNF